MYYATDLVKLPRYKKVLEEICKKPNVSISKVKSEHPENPSLTGNAFEILFSICQLDKKNFERAFGDEFGRAELNLRRLNPYIECRNYFKNDKLYCILTGKEYDGIFSVIRKSIGKKPVEILEQKIPFRYFEISTDIHRYPALLMDIRIKAGLCLSSPVCDVKRIVGFDSDSCAAYLKEIPNYFRNEINIFYKNGICTRSFVQAILYFTQVSHQFASHMLFDCLFISNDYLDQTTRQFKYFCKNHSQIKGKIYRTPNLDLLEIKARPDFLINKKLYEMKACKKFSLLEFFQALTYLIFAQHPENIKLHGAVKSVILYYVLTNQKIEIKAKDLNLTNESWIEIENSIRFYKAKKRRKIAF